MESIESEVALPAGTSFKSPYDVRDDVAGLKTLFVNVFFIGEPGEGNPWVLVDAGLAGYASDIKKKARELFGEGTKPEAIVLTHGHADHTGSLKTLLEEWDVPVYAHRLELPYLQGKSSYPPPDPAIGGGGMSYMSWVFPIGPSDFGDHVKAIADNGQIPELPGWRAIHTPGHAPGHVSLFRDKDRTLIAGDAFVTTNQNAITAVATQREEFHGPPAYFTYDWQAAKQSVLKLNNLNPLAAGTGHGVSVRGLDLELGLNKLAHDFEARSIPSSDGRYVKQPAITDENGIVDMPPPISFTVARTTAWSILAGLTLYLVWKGLKSRE
ncbi:MBL fold metallo-hydrolase [Spirosoma endophyticum]|uniref:Metallo-beta-lactamase superfamily protein n=1 Tax=Spirosoma endophyticum TaxID=662367 RepID=A0A1I1MBN2_9BACT|nr:MBL fold metallo-hydrolase [Spirosoma endophyticum]SFC82252.1 Metallo-beta-lactamase superfamily protein [Spirosoma endophyticum]